MSFNIDKIIKECPSGWEGCMKYFIHPHNYEALEFKYIWNPNTNRIEIWEGDYLDLEIHPRDLYDFFDSVGVKISIYYDGDDKWCYEVLPEDPELIIRERWYEARQDVEFIAIPKAFEIYEKQLGGV